MGALKSAVSGDSPKVVHVSGKLSGGISVGANTTLIGAPGTEIQSGGNTLNIAGNNVIIRNIAFKGVPDGSADMALIKGKNHIWLDHLELVDGADGMLDIVGGSDHITISWSKFYYTAKTAHQNAILLSSSNGSGDDGKNNITFHHNWFAENIAERTPRVRFGKVHIFNNLYEGTIGFSYYAVRCGYEANVRSEHNIYKDFKGLVKYDENVSKTGESLVFNYFDGSANSVLESVGDVFINCTERAVDGDGAEGGTFSKGGPAFMPPYEYSLDGTATLEAAIKMGAGPTLPAP